MNIIAVDLAAKFSAAVCIGEPAEAHGTPTIVSQWDSWQRSQSEFITETCAAFDPLHRYAFTSTPRVVPDALIVEDLPQRVPWMSTVKDVCRLQGRFIERMHDYGQLHKLVFAPPHAWRRTYPGLERGTGPDAVVAVAARKGYTPPDLSERCGPQKGTRSTARKVATDYCAAFLIANWAYEHHYWNGSFDAPTTTRITAD